MNMFEYAFNEDGINAMYNDCVDLVFSVLESENFDSLIDGIDALCKLSLGQGNIPLQRRYMPQSSAE